MKTKPPVLRRMVLAVFVPGILAIASAPFGCDTTQQLLSDSDVPASQGTVTVGAADNGNTDVTVRVKHLAPPAKLAPEAKIYVVWIQPKDGAKQNVGALTLNDELEGSLATLTPHRRFLLTVTPEPGGRVIAPTHSPVFTSWVERK
ncbi:MAG: hypothetical protein M0R80_22780 [Proteobacteria bacterium]|nr:hypothetical protein [Pseudomonadota bacterium]